MIIHNTKELASYVKNYRKQLKRSQGEVGDAVGLKQATVSAFENNPDAAKIDTLFRLLAALNLDIHLHPKGEKIKTARWQEEW